MTPRTPTIARAVGNAFFGPFKALQPAQQSAIRQMSNGLDAIILADTGSGKTEAAVAPLIDIHLEAMRRSNCPVVVYVSPTRALANDIERRLERPLQELGLRLGIRHGERNDLERKEKPAIIITTPESLDVMVTSREALLKEVRAVVLDEIHVLHGTQRGFQLAIVLKRLESLIGRAVQCVGLSATVGQPGDIWSFIRPHHEFALIEERAGKAIDACIIDATDDVLLAGFVDQAIELGAAKILLFVGSRRECDRVGTVLKQRSRFGEGTYVHHSSLDRRIRLRVEEEFQKRRSAICVTTTTLELGIDIGDIDLVALYGPPPSWQAFVQRVGRGNRRSRISKVACLIPAGSAQPVSALAFEALIRQATLGPGEPRGRHELYGPAVQQLLCALMEQEGAYQRRMDLYSLFADWPHLSPAVIDEIIDELIATDHVRAHAVQNRIGAGEQTHELRRLRLIWGNLPAGRREVSLRAHGHELGTIGADNLPKLHRGAIIRFAGRHWEIINVKARAVNVLPTSNRRAIDLTYFGSSPTTSPATVEQMHSILTAGGTLPNLAKTLEERIGGTSSRIAACFGAGRVPFFQDQNGYHYFTFAGKTMNSVLASWFGSASCAADDLVLRSPVPIDFSRLPASVEDLRAAARSTLGSREDLSIFQAMLPRHLLEEEMLNDWVTEPAFARALARLRESQCVAEPQNVLASLCT